MCPEIAIVPGLWVPFSWCASCARIVQISMETISSYILKESVNLINATNLEHNHHHHHHFAHCKNKLSPITPFDWIYGVYSPYTHQRVYMGIYWLLLTLSTIDKHTSQHNWWTQTVIIMILPLDTLGQQLWQVAADHVCLCVFIPYCILVLYTSTVY